MKKKETNFPPSLFLQPDFEFLFQFIDKGLFPKIQGFPIIGGFADERKDFWNALKMPYSLSLKEETDGTLSIKFEEADGPIEEYEDLTRFLKDEKFASELFAVHWLLKDIVVTGLINQLRKKPELSPNQLKYYSQHFDLRKQMEDKNKENLKKDINNYKSAINNPVISEEEKKLIEERKKWTEEALKRKNKVDQERDIRRKISKQLSGLLNEICISEPQGIYPIGAFLVFSSGFSYRGKKSNIEIHLDWDKNDMPDSFRQDLNR